MDASAATIEVRNASGHADESQPGVSQDSQTASEFIQSQLQLEADAREVLPYAFDSCSQPLGPLRQTVFACLTCSPPPASEAQVYTPAGICYSCSISCHGDHTLVELFSRRNFVCDCGSTRLPSTSPCTLRRGTATNAKSVHSQPAAQGNHYNHNFQNRFCGCEEEYNADEEKGTMFQCLGLGTVETGGCGEDWWHPECLMGLSKKGDKHQSSKEDHINGLGDVAKKETDTDAEVDESGPPGFPSEDDFEALICYKCVESNPWIKQYANSPGFLAPLHRGESANAEAVDQKPLKEEADLSQEVSISGGSASESKKRKIDESDPRSSSPPKRLKETSTETNPDTETVKTEEDNNPPKPKQKHDLLPPAPTGQFSLLLQEDFRNHICHCPTCYPNLLSHPQLLEEEEIYQPPISETASNPDHPSSARSQGTGSLLERGEAALSTIDRVRAIEGVMAYNHIKDKVKDFLKPYAESKKVVSAEDVKAYFETLRGDDKAIREARSRHGLGQGIGDGEDDKENGDDQRREQSGY